VTGRKKKLKQQVIDQMLARQISVPEAKARWAWIKTGRYQPPRRPGAGQAMAVKSAGPVTGYEQYDAHPDPRIRERARAAAHQEMLAKGLVPWAEPARGDGSNVRGLVWAPGPDGRPGWRAVPAAPAAGPPIVPPGIAGR
jgi:hypothetical protein